MQKKFVLAAAACLLAAGLFGCAGGEGPQGDAVEIDEAQVAGVAAEATSPEAPEAAATTEAPAPEPAPASEPAPAPVPEPAPAPAASTDYTDTLFVGDSVMVLASGVLYETFPGVTIDATSGRTLETGGPNEDYSDAFGIIDIMRADNSAHARYVIGAASNEYYGMTLEAGREIVALAGDAQVWFVTQMVTNNTDSTTATNAAIDALVIEYPNVHKIDWHTQAVEHPEYIADNCHATDEGRIVYANLIRAALG